MENNQQPLASGQQTDQLNSVSPKTSYHPSTAFIIITVALLTIAVGLGGYILGANQNQITQNQTQPPPPITQPSPTPLPSKASATEGVDETANWKTYTNTDWFFSIKYPSDWLEGEHGIIFSDIKSFGIVFGPATTESHIGEKIPPTATPSVAIQIIKTDKNDLEEAVQDFNSCIYKEVNLRKSINIDGQAAFLFEEESLCGLGNPRDVAYVMNRENLYEITVNRNVETNQILSAFRFD